MVFFLVGYMGSGKSTIGKALAKRTGFRFMDMDREIERRCGRTVAGIFAEEGEPFFRKCEKELIAELESCGTNENLIVATGGGAPCFDNNMDVMNRSGVTIYLRMTPGRLMERLRYGREKRPLIQDMDDRQLTEFIEKNLVSRGPVYEKAAMIIDCDGVSDQYVCGHIEGMISRVMNNEELK